MVEVRKTVTIVFSDLAGSTAIGEGLDPETLHGLMSRYHEALRGALELHGGTVEKFIGDAVMAVFGVPVVHEDDAIRALRAAVGMRHALAQLNTEIEPEYGVRLETRTGVNTGEVMAGEGEALVTGDVVNVAARLEQAAAPGEILLGPQTYALTREAIRADVLERLELKGKAEPLAAFRLQELLPDVPAFTNAIAGPFVGREAELDALRVALGRAVAERSCQLVTVVGPPGIGKSRLARELVHAKSEARVVVGRCLPYGEGITYGPLAEIVREIGPIEAILRGQVDADLIAARIAGAIGAGEAVGNPEETAWAFRRLFEALAEANPLVVVLDDIHWAEPTLLDLIEYIAGFSIGTSILLLCAARTDLFDERPSWAAPRPNVALLPLEPLSDGDAHTLVERLGHLPEEQGRQVIEVAEGNPLFVEQLLAMQVDSRGGALVAPPSIQALLAARIDRLEPGERSVVEAAAVEGRAFHQGAVAALVGDEVRSAVGSHLLALVRKQFVRADRATFPGDDGFRFAHILIRDAAYEAVPKKRRARLHEHYVRWLEAKAGERDAEYEELLGYHLEQASRCRAELGTPDDELASRAAERLGRAGERALARSDIPAAVNLLTRCGRTAPADSPARAAYLRLLAEARMAAGDLGGADAAFAEAIERAARAGDERTRWRSIAQHLRLREQTDPGAVEADRSQADEVIAALEELGDDLGLAKAWLLRTDVHNMRREGAAMEEAAERVVLHAGRAGAVREESEGIAWVGAALIGGPRPVPPGINRCEQLLARASGQYGEAEALVALGVLRMMNGDLDEGRDLYRRGHGIARNLGMRLVDAGMVNQSGYGELVAGDPETAEAVLRRGYDELAEMGEVGWMPTAADLLARALCEQGRYSDAERYWQVAEDLSEGELFYHPTIGGGARARILAARGETDAALAVARHSVDVARSTEDLNGRADTHIDYADVLRLAGMAEEQATALRDALALYELKGNIAAAARTRARIDDIRSIGARTA
jgi:class 3 adenylate cyclase/tetratricopeptide (TPR) repeat protein